MSNKERLEKIHKANVRLQNARVLIGAAYRILMDMGLTNIRTRLGAVEDELDAIAHFLATLEGK